MSEFSNETMKRVWKVGSRWSDDGHAGSSILDIFRNYNVFRNITNVLRKNTSLR